MFQAPCGLGASGAGKAAWATMREAEHSAEAPWLPWTPCSARVERKRHARIDPSPCNCMSPRRGQLLWRRQHQMARRYGRRPHRRGARVEGSQRAIVLRFDLGDDVVTAEADATIRCGATRLQPDDEEFAETSALVARERRLPEQRRAAGAVRVQSRGEVRQGAGHRHPHEGLRHPARGGRLPPVRQLLVGVRADDIAAIRIPACASIEAQRALTPTAPSTWKQQQAEAESTNPCCKRSTLFRGEVELRRARGGMKPSCRARSRRRADGQRAC